MCKYIIPPRGVSSLSINNTASMVAFAPEILERTIPFPLKLSENLFLLLLLLHLNWFLPKSPMSLLLLNLMLSCQVSVYLNHQHYVTINHSLFFKVQCFPSFPRHHALLFLNIAQKSFIPQSYLLVPSYIPYLLQHRWQTQGPQA